MYMLEATVTPDMLGARVSVRLTEFRGRRKTVPVHDSLWLWSAPDDGAEGLAQMSAALRRVALELEAELRRVAPGVSAKEV